MNNKNRLRSVISLFLSLYLVVNVCVAADADEYENDGDPLENLNQIFYGINDVIDRAFLEPVATFYVDHAPEGLQRGVSNFFDNIAYLGVIINDLLQGKGTDAAKDTGRFIVNTTIGIAGIFDPATSLGMERHEEDFGQTLGVWGAGEGAYLVLPLLGPSSVRDVPGVAMGMFTNILYYIEGSMLLPLIAVSAIDKRAELLTATRLRDQSTVGDPYIVTRSAYRQRRNHLIYDGDPPMDTYYEEEEEEAKK